MISNNEKDRYHDMNKERTLGLIKKCDIEIPILRSDYSYFIRDNGFKRLIGDYERRLSDIYEESNLKRKFQRNLNLFVMSDYNEGSLYLGYSTKYIIKLIYSILDINDSVKLDNLNVLEFENRKEKIEKTLKNYIINIKNEINNINSKFKLINNSVDYSYLMDLRKSLYNKYKFALASLNNLDNIFELHYDRTINEYYVDKKTINRQTNEEKIEKNIHIAWRNLAYLIAISSLELYDKTKEDKYLIYPFSFYEKCTKIDSKGKQMLYAEEYYSQNAKYDSRFINYNKECERVLNNSSLKLDYLLNYSDNNRIMVDKKFISKKLSFTEDELKKHITGKLKKRRGVSSEEEAEKAKKQLDSKLSFYSKDTEFGKHVVARVLTLDQKNNGYIGFILDNNNIVLDRFYKEYKDGSSVPVINEAVYALPLDLYESYGHNMTTIKQSMKNPLILHKYHTESDSYTDALLSLTKKESISLLSAEVFARNHGIKLDEKKLIKINKSNNKKDQ